MSFTRRPKFPDLGPVDLDPHSRGSREYDLVLIDRCHTPDEHGIVDEADLMEGFARRRKVRRCPAADRRGGEGLGEDEEDAGERHPRHRGETSGSRDLHRGLPLPVRAHRPTDLNGPRSRLQFRSRVLQLGRGFSRVRLGWRPDSSVRRCVHRVWVIFEGLGWDTRFRTRKSNEFGPCFSPYLTCYMTPYPVAMNTLYMSL